MIHQLKGLPQTLLSKLKATRRPGEIPLGAVSRYLPRNPTIVEAGAHVGLDTQSIARYWPQGEVHAFEPVSLVFAQLLQNTSGLSNVRCYQKALGEKDGRADLHVSGGGSDGSSSLLAPKEHLTLHPEVSFTETQTVEVVSLDRWARSTGVSQVDFLWLDLQGYELAALKGAQGLLGGVSAIHTEVNLVEVYAGAPLYRDLWSWLEKHGFKVAQEAIDWEDGGNVLFVRE